MSPAAVRIDSSSSSRVVAPSARAAIVRVDTIIGSTPRSPSDARATALTILFTSTGSSMPLRFRTRMLVAASTVVVASSTAVRWSSVIAMCSPSPRRVFRVERRHARRAAPLTASPPQRVTDL